MRSLSDPWYLWLGRVSPWILLPWFFYTLSSRGLGYDQDWHFIGLTLPVFWGGSTYLIAGRLRAVWLDGDCLYVSNLYRLVRVPIPYIERVDRLTPLSTTLTLVLKEDTGLGKRIKFMPSFNVWSSETKDVQQMLQRMIAKSRENELHESTRQSDGAH